MLFDKNTFNLRKIRNRFRLARDYKKGNTRTSGYPVELALEITNKCNLACIMCPRVNMNRPAGLMDFDLFKAIIDQVKDYMELVYFSGGVGEPTLHPRLFDMLKYCRKSGVRVGISTNASLLDVRMTDCLLQNPSDIILFSLDGATKETHERIRVGSKFEKTIGNVEYFLKEKEKRRLRLPYTVVQMVYMPENQGEADLFRKRWKKYKSVDDIRMKKFLYLQGANRYPDAISDVKKSDRLSCILPWRQLSISWDGKLAICCRDFEYTEEIGSLKDHSIQELWNSENMQSFRKLLSSGEKDKIKTCKNCGGIAANIFLRTASIIFDDLTIRKLLPIAEKFASKTGIKAIDYE